MNFTLKIKEIKTISEITGYWTSEDYIHLLENLDFTDVKNSSPSELRELLEMAISDLEPHESAEILLRYKLRDKLNSGQISNLSHEMEENNESEDNPDIALHYPLFNINQLLRKAYNGRFPDAKATSMEFELRFKGETEVTVTRELALISISKGLSDKSPLMRLFENQLNGKELFGDAEKVIWEFHHHGQHDYTIITSDYWINKEDMIEHEFSGSIKLFEDKEKAKNTD
ncbi:hypothetical protein KKI24_19810 [bacterium]|nr:hypothetical protein [bacterium]